MDRRTFLAESAGGVALLSGAAVPASAVQDSDADESAPPTVTGLDEDRWEVLEDTSAVHERSLGLISVTVRERTRVWEDRRLRDRLDVVTRGTLDRTMMLFFESRLDIEGLLSGGVGVADIEDVALPEFEERLDDHGLERVRTVPLGAPRPDLGARANTHEYAAEYPVDRLRRNGGLGGAPPRSGRNDGPLAVTGLLSVWLGESGTGYVAGGLFPAAPYEMESAVGVDLELTPERYRRDAVDLIESVA